MSYKDDEISVKTETVCENVKTTDCVCEMRFFSFYEENPQCEISLCDSEERTNGKMEKYNSRTRNSKSAEEKKQAAKRRFFRKPDVTSLVLCIMLVVFSLYYILQVYMYDADTLKLVYSQKPAAVSEENTAGILCVNINTADTEELCELKGIGEARARAIIEYRSKNGSFRSVEDIKNVSGIGDGIFEKIKDDICVD